MPAFCLSLRRLPCRIDFATLLFLSKSFSFHSASSLDFCFMSQDFVHLRMHSEYSFRDSTIRLKQVVHKSGGRRNEGFSMYGCRINFRRRYLYKACLGQGLKPIIGVDAWIRNPSDAHHPSKLLLLCANAHGYHTLCDLLTKAWLENQVDEKGAD